MFLRSLRHLSLVLLVVLGALAVEIRAAELSTADPIQPPANGVSVPRAPVSWFVDADGPGPGTDGTSCNAPFHDIRDALSSQQGGAHRIRPGDTILVAPGSYSSFVIGPLLATDPQFPSAPRGIAIRGVTEFEECGEVLDPSTGSLIVVEPQNDRRSGPGIFIAEGDERPGLPHAFRTEIEGLAIRNWTNEASGFAGVGIAAHGGFGSSPTFRRCHFENNLLREPGLINAGGAIAILARCRPIVDGCTFVSNVTDTTSRDPDLYGGAIGIGALAITASGVGGIAPGSMPYPIITDCTFSNNSATCRGGAIAMAGASVLIQGCHFDQNNATFSGGAVFGKMLGEVRIENCVFENGTSGNEFGGAVVLSWRTDANRPGLPPPPFRIIGNRFQNNVSPGSAVAIINADATISHNQFIGNTGLGYEFVVDGTQFGPTGPALSVLAVDNRPPGSVGEAVGATITPDADLDLQVRIVNNLFAGNITDAGQFGAAAVWLHTDDVEDFSARLNVEFINNTSADHGFGAVALSEGTGSNGHESRLSLLIVNSILWDDGLREVLASNDAQWSVFSTDSAEDFTALHASNFRADPLFAPQPGNYRPLAESPVRDVAQRRYWLRVLRADAAIPNTDLDGLQRGANGEPLDVGAYGP
ncbi:MAG: right-handed parallel beta-helix repeat-containing protein [Planctomycetes bacterium]|nr:right-handed parallel beta-helix repeat-containing protein [Planctomycetota bacterium]